MTEHAAFTIVPASKCRNDRSVDLVPTLGEPLITSFGKPSNSKTCMNTSLHLFNGKYAATCGSVILIGATQTYTQPICMCYIFELQTTFYGDKWQFGAGGNNADTDEEPLEFSDTAYTTEAIGVHNDGTYFSQPPGIQARIYYAILSTAVAVAMLWYSVF